ncbi:hypothetical protein HW132_35065 [Brasilonema sp. CT11]|nr:hypothetical protein [Brasilonema sp. CT11]
MIVETDGAGKMTPEGFKKYIEGTLKGKDKGLMQMFYEVLKDDPIELVKGGSQEVNFRFELIGRQIDAWKQELLTSGKAATSFDLQEGPCGRALDFYSKIGKNNQEALATLKEKILDYLKTNKNIIEVHLNKRLSDLEAVVVDALIGHPNLEKLTIFLHTQEAIEKVSQLLLHPDCKLKSLLVDAAHVGYSYEDDEDDDTEKKGRDYSVVAAALLKTSAPLEELQFETMPNEDVAKSVADWCTRPNGLKRMFVRNAISENSSEILTRGQVESKTLKEVSISAVNPKGKENTELAEFVMKNLPLNPSLENIGFIRYVPLTAEQLAKALSIPSLKKLSWVSLADMSFVSTTSQLKEINTPFSCTVEQMTPLSNFLIAENCPLETLLVEKSTLEPGVGVTLGKSLVHNKSIKTFNLRKSTFKDNEDAKCFVDLIIQWLEKSYCNVSSINLGEMSNVIFAGETFKRLLTVLKTNTSLKQLTINATCTAEDLPLLIELINQNSTLVNLEIGGTSRVKLSAEERAPLKEAMNANTNLKLFRVPLLDHSECKYLRVNWDEFLF